MTDADSNSRPLHLQPLALVIVLLGGVGGVAAREMLMLIFPTMGAIAWATFSANLTGAFLLGILLDALARRGPDHGRRRLLRLLLGTGFMGGYTTYSSLATDTAVLLGSGAVGTGIVYSITTIVAGGLATWVGIFVATLTHRRRTGAAQ